MARPSSRRPGQNRKAQYGLFASYLVAVSGAFTGLLLIGVATFDPTGFAVIRSGAAELVRPISATMKSLVSGVGSADEWIAAYVNAGSQNAALLRQVAANRTRLIEAAAIEQENIRLKKLLRLVEDEKAPVVAARIISSSSSSTRRFARLNAGRAQNVYPGMPVRAPEGLIGRVNTSGINTADVLLLTDSSNIVPVRRAKDDIAGLSAGRDDGSVEIRSLTAGNNPFVPGDIMVTSGTGGLYSPNIPVAIVVRVEGDSAIGVPLANPARVEAVIVQKPYEASVARPPTTTVAPATGRPATAIPSAAAPAPANNAAPPEAPVAGAAVNQSEPSP